MENCEFSKTGGNKVQLALNICKRNHFHKKLVFSWEKAPFPQKQLIWTSLDL